MSSDVEIDRQEHIVRLRLNRPEKKNALTTDMYHTMAAVIENAETDLDVRAIVFLGCGGHFTSGNDLSDFPAELPDDQPTPPGRFISSIVHSSVPMVAGVSGIAAGIGATMLLHLDSVVAAADAKILMPFVNLALVPEGGSSLLLPTMMGYTRAAELLMRGKAVFGQRAYELGIASQVTDAAEVDNTVLSIAAEFAEKPPEAMRKTKRLLKGDRELIAQRIAWEEQQLFECFASVEHQAIVNRLLKK